MQNLAFFLVSGLLLVISGCTGGGPPPTKLYPVTGKVTVAGKPIENCVVQFVSVGGEGGFSGKIGSDGTYTLVDMKDGRQGAEVGKYKVVLQNDPQAAMKAMQSGQMTGPGQVAAALPFPAAYSSVDSTPKEVEVKSESNTINIEIP